MNCLGPKFYYGNITENVFTSTPKEVKNRLLISKNHVNHKIILNHLIVKNNHLSPKSRQNTWS